jgi:hypothetical protein
VGFDPATRRRKLGGGSDSRVLWWGELTFSLLGPVARRP